QAHSPLPLVGVQTHLDVPLEVLGDEADVVDLEHVVLLLTPPELRLGTAERLILAPDPGGRTLRCTMVREGSPFDGRVAGTRDVGLLARLVDVQLQGTPFDKDLT